MLIGVDAHNLEGNRTGVGRYLFNLLKEWAKKSFKFQVSSFKFILYFKDEIPVDLSELVNRSRNKFGMTERASDGHSEFISESPQFECRLLKVNSTAKFIHWDLPRAAKKDKVDVLFFPGYVVPICYSGKIALTLHDIIYEARPEWFNWKSPADKILLKWVSKKAAKKAVVIFVPSEFTRQEVLRYYQVASEKVKLIYLAVEPNLAGFSESDIQKVKEKYRIKNNFVFYAGSIFSRRHLAEIISAFGYLAAQRSDLQLLLAGKDYTREKNIADLIARQNDALSREVVVRVDFVDDFELKLLYSACAFFIWLSDYEGFGLPPLEAMSAGAPVITSDSTSLKEVADEAALLIKNNSDVEEIYKAMKRLAEDENLRRELIIKGKEQAKKFSWEKCADVTLRTIIGVIASEAKQSRGRR